jgi:hypothetical protein
MSKTQDCNICIENKSVKNFIICSKCNFSACKTCVKHYLLELQDINPRCMKCSAQWDFDFIANNTEQEFHNDIYREHRAKIIVERERSLLPATQTYAQTRQMSNNIDNQIDNIDQEIGILMIKVAELKKEKNKLTDKWYEIQEKLVLESKKENPKKEDKKISKFIGHCPKQDCNGYLQEDYSCGLCKSFACKKCHLIKHENPCDPNLIKSVELISKETKNCPNCNVPIYKIEGCDQMWCVSCHTPFSWTKGKIEQGVIHNPHYYEYQRRNNIEVEQRRRCDGQVDIASVFRVTRNNCTTQEEQTISASHRCSAHIRNTILDRKYLDLQVNIETNLDLRVDYLLNNITDKDWVSQIKKREKKREKQRAIRLILNMLVDTVDELHWSLSEQKISIPDCLTQMENLRQYVCEEFSKIQERFNNKVPNLSDNWKFTDVGQRKTLWEDL